MSYRCQLCNAIVPHGTPLRRHVVYRSDRSIEQEIPVCEECGADLANGLGIIDVLRKRSVAPALTVEEVKAKPLPKPIRPKEAKPLFSLDNADGKLVLTPVNVPLKAVQLDPTILGQRKLRQAAAEAKAVRKRPTVKAKK